MIWRGEMIMRYADLRDGNLFQIGEKLSTILPVFTISIMGSKASMIVFRRGVARIALNTTPALRELPVGTFFSTKSTGILYQKVDAMSYQLLSRTRARFAIRDDSVPVVLVEIAGEYSWG